MTKKLKGKVVDYSNRNFLVLCFRSGDRETMLLEELENYLISIGSPYNLNQFLSNVPLQIRLDIITEAYHSDFKK